VVTFWLAPKVYPESEPRPLSIIHVNEVSKSKGKGGVRNAQLRFCQATQQVDELTILSGDVTCKSPFSKQIQQKTTHFQLKMVTLDENATHKISLL